jgi:hypothetical protein
MPEPHVYGHLEYVWMTAYETGNAIIGDFLDVELAAQWKGEPSRFCQALEEAGFLDYLGDGDGRWAVHDLLDHAPEYVQQRARREAERRKEKKCGYCGVTFHSSELHAAYCSGACRQGAYRDRRDADVTDSTDSDEGVRNSAAHQDADVTHVTKGDEEARNSYGPVTGCDAPPAPAPSKEEDPPTPQGGNASAATKTRKRRREATAEPEASTEREAAARRVIQHYQATVAPDHGTDGGISNVLALLSKGIDEATLLACADHYAASCRDKEPQFRMKVRNFYGKVAGYKDYLHEQPGQTPRPGASETAEQYAARQKAENAELDRRLAKRQQDRAAANGEAPNP